MRRKGIVMQSRSQHWMSLSKVLIISFVLSFLQSCTSEKNRQRNKDSEAEAPEAEFRCERSSRILILSVTWSKLTNRSEHIRYIVWPETQAEDLGMNPSKNKQVSANKRLIWKLFELWEGFSKRNKTVYYSQG